MTATLPIGHPVLLFDLDGTLVDSEPVFWRTVQQVLAELQVDASTQRQLHHQAPRVAEVAESLPQAHRAAFEARMANRLGSVVEELSDRVCSCAIQLLTRSRDAGRRTALVTNSSHEYTRRLLTRTAAEDLFDVITTCEDVTSPKPAADPYVTTMAKLGVRPQDCVAFEDSVEGIHSARDAGIGVVVVRAACQEGPEWCFHDVELVTR